MMMMMMTMMMMMMKMTTMRVLNKLAKVDARAPEDNENAFTC